VGLYRFGSGRGTGAPPTLPLNPSLLVDFYQEEHLVKSKFYMALSCE
jgi:hypothetical protein